MDTKDFASMRRILFGTLVLLSVSGFMLHLRIHYFIDRDPQHPGFSPTYFIANLFPFIDAFIVTALFASKRTSVYGYLLNGIIVIYGTVFMAHFSIAELMSKSMPFYNMLLKSTVPDIGIAWGDFFIGKALYDLYMKQ